MRTRSVQDVTVFASGVPHPEGVAVARDGRLYTGGAAPSYGDAGPVYRISPDGRQVEPFANTGGRVLGVAFDRHGHLFVCDVLQGAVFRITPSGKVHLFADGVGERRLLKPNFLVFDRQGRLYVSDSGTARAGERTAAVYRFEVDGAGVVFLDGLVFANGLALSPAEDALYVVETRDNRVLRAPIGLDGTAGAPDVYIDRLVSGPDGLAVDHLGNLYVTVTRPSRVVCVSPTRQRVDLVFDPEDTRLHAPSNLAFGGPDRRRLYIANLFGQHIAALDVDHPGWPLYHQSW